MHNTNIKMKDGRIFCAPIYQFNIRLGFIQLFGVDEKLYFENMIYAITENQRVGINTINTVDEIQRYLKLKGDLK